MSKLNLLILTQDFELIGDVDKCKPIELKEEIIDKIIIDKKIVNDCSIEHMYI